MLDAIIGGLIGAAVPVSLASLYFAVSWGSLKQLVQTHQDEIARLREWRGKHTDLHSALGLGTVHHEGD